MNSHKPIGCFYGNPTGVARVVSIDPVHVTIHIYILGYIVSYLLSRPGFTFNPTGTISIPLIIPTGFVALSASERAETELRLIRHM